MTAPRRAQPATGWFRGAFPGAFLAMAVAFGPAPCAAQPVPPGPALEAAWAALGPATRGWTLQVTPAFPTAWPADGTTRRYAFAYRVPPRMADAAEVAAPWAVAEQRPGAPATVIPLGQGLSPLGLQGVRPMGGEEMALAGRTAEVDALLATPPDAAGAALIRAFHCNWRRRQGVIAAAVLPLHPAFDAWLGCR